MTVHEELNVDELVALDHAALVEIWHRVMDGAPPKRLSAPLMRRYLAHQIQIKRSRGLTKRDEDKLKAMAKPNRRAKAPSLLPGSQLIREWNGRQHQVEVLEKGFRWNDATYRSLSAIAEAITGTRWSGPRFFGIDGRSPS